MADPPRHPDTGDDTGVEPDRAERRPAHITLAEGGWDYRAPRGPVGLASRSSAKSPAAPAPAAWIRAQVKTHRPRVATDPMTITPGIRKFALSALSRPWPVGTARPDLGPRAPIPVL